MKLLLILAASVVLALAGCNRSDEPKTSRPSAAGGSSSSSMETPYGGATGQASEGSTDRSSAPKRPASK